MKKIIKFFGFVSVLAVSVLAQQSHDFPITRFPTWIVPEGSEIVLEVPNLSDEFQNDNTVIRFSRTPGGADVANYSDSIRDFSTRRFLDDDGRQMFRITFSLQANRNLRSGINYLIVHNREVNKNSNEIKLILGHSEQNSNLQTDGRVIGASQSRTPRFSWTRPAGVPFSHVVLSDEEIKVDPSNLSLEAISGISMVWQAITRDNSIVYGEPDPSGIFSAAPPPLSPGKTYSWFVFNNYANSPPYTSVGVKMPATFTILGPIRPSPEGVFPEAARQISHTENEGRITFRWTNLDPLALVYRLFLYTNSEMSGLKTQVLIWSGDVMAGQFTDTASLTMTAANILSSNQYSWRVVAMYADGSGQTGDTKEFSYIAPSGTINVRTYEEIIFGDQRFTQPLALAQVDLEVLQGSLEETILFSTDENGWARRVRSVGTQRITVKKDGYESVSRIIQLRENQIEDVVFHLRRPFSSIFGNVTDQSGAPVNLANIVAVSDNGDTVRTQSLPCGNFVLNCASGDWTVTVSRQGFANSASSRVNLRNGQNENRNFRLERIGLTLSGTVRNDEGQAVTGATVRLFNEDRSIEVATLLSTPDNGRFSFAVPAGVYQLAVSQSGLAPYEERIEFASSQNRVITLSRGAAMLSGTLYGVSWIGTRQIRAALTNARIEVIDTANGMREVIAAGTTDRVYGTFSITVRIPASSSSRYLMRFSAEGFTETERYFTNVAAATGVTNGHTHTQDFDINAFASINGILNSPLGAGARQGVTVSLAASNGIPVSVTTTDNGGNFSFFRVPDGRYTILAGGQGQTINNAVLATDGGDVISGTVKIENGRFFVDSEGGAAVSSIEINTKEANATVIWTANQSAQDVSAISFTVFSPFVQGLQNGTLQYAASDVNYLLRATSNDTRIISLVQKTFNFTDEEIAAGDGTVTRAVNIPFRYRHNTENDTQKVTLTVDRLSGIDVTVQSARVRWRVRGETAFNSVSATAASLNAETINFEIDLGEARAGNHIEYFFEITTQDASRYSNETYLYSRFIHADRTVITRTELIPNTGGDTLKIALNGRIEAAIKAFFGANFTPIENLPANAFTFRSSDNNVLNVSQSSSAASAVLTGRREGRVTLTVSLNAASHYSAVSPSVGSISIPVKVTDSEIQNISVFLLSTPENPGFILNREPVIFATHATDKKGEAVSVTPRWIVRPQEAGRLDAASGLFTPNPNFVGRVFITAQINSRIRHEFSMDNERGMLIGHTAMPASAASERSAAQTVTVDNARNDSKAGLVFSAGRISAPVTLLLDNPEIRNSVMRSVEPFASDNNRRRHLLGEIVQVHRHIGENLSDSAVQLKLFVPQLYHDIIGNGDSLDIAIWDARNLRWEFPRDHSQEEIVQILQGTATFLLVNNRAAYCPNEKSLTLPIGDFISDLNTFSAAIVARGLSSEGYVSISPNPFSPFVSPMSDYFHIEGMNGNVKGACIKITTGGGTGNYNPNAQVSIFNADGTMVYNVRLNGLIPGQSYYLFWDGRVQRSQTVEFEGGIEANRALWIRGNEGSPLLRNGRYFVNVSLDDGRRVRRHTKEIILFK